MHVVHCNAFFFAQRALSLYMLPKVIAKLTCGIVFAAFSLSDNYPSSLWLVKGERWVFIRGVHGPVRFGFNLKIQLNQKIVFLINMTRTEPRTGSDRTNFVRFGSVF
jgi:hypothetical protein